MKKIILTFSLFIALTVVSKAQTNAAGNVTPEKPKTVVEQSKTGTANKSADTTNSAATSKKPAKKSCCKKDAGAMPCDNKGTAKPKSSATKQN